MGDEADEETVVRPRSESAAPPPEFTQVQRDTAAAPITVDRFNPWRIIVPAAVALVVVFAVVFLLTRGSSPPTDPNQPALTADPNSTPVRPAGTPTGESEVNILPVSVASPTPVGSPVETPTRTPPTVTGDFENENTNANRANRNTNQPVPDPETEPPPPPPRPSPTVRTVPRATPSAATASPSPR